MGVIAWCCLRTAHVAPSVSRKRSKNDDLQEQSNSFFYSFPRLLTLLSAFAACCTSTVISRCDPSAAHSHQCDAGNTTERYQQPLNPLRPKMLSINHTPRLQRTKKIKPRFRAVDRNDADAARRASAFGFQGTKKKKNSPPPIVCSSLVRPSELAANRARRAWTAPKDKEHYCVYGGRGRVRMQRFLHVEVDERAGARADGMYPA